MAAMTGFMSRSRVGPIGPAVLGHRTAIPFRQRPAIGPAARTRPPAPVRTATEAASSASKAMNVSSSSVRSGGVDGVAQLRTIDHDDADRPVVANDEVP